MLLNFVLLIVSDIYMVTVNVLKKVNFFTLLILFYVIDIGFVNEEVLPTVKKLDHSKL